MRVRVALAAGAVVVAAGLIAVLAEGNANFLGTNSTNVDLSNGIVLTPGRRACQDGETVLAHAARVKLIVSTARLAGGPLAVSVSSHGALVAAGRGPAGYRDEPVSVPLDRPLGHSVSDARVCVRNDGHVTVAVLGPDERGAGAARLDGAPPAAEAMRLEWYGPPHATRFGEAGHVSQRLGLAKASFFGAWLLWVALALALLAAAAAVAALLRGLPTQAGDAT